MPDSFQKAPENRNQIFRRPYVRNKQPWVRNVQGMEFAYDKFSGDWKSTNKFKGLELTKYEHSKYTYVLKTDKDTADRELNKRVIHHFLKEQMLGLPPRGETYCLWKDHKKYHQQQPLKEEKMEMKKQEDDDYSDYESKDSEQDPKTEESDEVKTETQKQLTLASAVQGIPADTHHKNGWMTWD